MFSITAHIHHRAPPLTSFKPPKPLYVSALIIPPSSSSTSSQTQKQQQLYQPFRRPAPPLPSRYRSLDTNEKIEILSCRSGSWFDYAPLIPLLVQEGFISTTIEELTGIPSVEQNRLVVAAQVRDSLIESAPDEIVSFFDPPGSPAILYEIRILNTPQRAAAARFIISNEFEGKQSAELAKSMKDFPRRYGDRGWECFDADLPGDCLAFMYYRQAQEYKSASSPELSKASLEKALKAVESDRAREKVMDELLGRSEGTSDTDQTDSVRVPIVRMAYGEVAESRIVVVFPVCRAEMRELEVEDAPWECGMGGEFGVVEAEKGWRRWVVLPGSAPVADLKKGGVAVAFPKARGILPWRNKKRDTDEEILVVADRSRKGVEQDDQFYLVVSSGNGEGLKVERGAKLNEMGVKTSLGTVVLVVRPPREELNEQSTIEDWE